ncbi:YfhD family protein [Alteribacter populi]|uniref:YfhD family protein n=1 Tax=Alteribacter populi TaxID=2011011 RepID=UPI000BBACBA9|nr:YfhD family protein [Alteribacter populi]
MSKDNKRDKNIPDLKEVQDNEVVEYSEEVADTEDLEAQARAKAADHRVNTDNI